MGCIACAGLIRATAQERTLVRLRLKDESRFPLEAASVRPDLFATLSNQGIKNLPASRGGHQTTLGELFEIEGEYNQSVVVEGGCARVARLGQGMAGGRLEVRGDTGAHLGEHMRGGEIAVARHAGGFAGAHMHGGLIRIAGNAGGWAAGACAGHPAGMDRGTVIIGGNAGPGAGACMRQGLLVILGDAGDYAGTGLAGGTILVFGALGRRAGTGNRRGSIVAFGRVCAIPPAYRLAYAHRPACIGHFLEKLRGLGLAVPEGLERARYARYVRGGNISGKGEILVRCAAQ